MIHDSWVSAQVQQERADLKLSPLEIKAGLLQVCL